MKKINISSQLILIFFSVILIASCAFSIITVYRLRLVAEEEVYSRLSTYVYLINESNQIEETPNFPDMSVGYIINKEQTSFSTENIDQFVSEEEKDNLINKIETNISNTNKNKYPFIDKGVFEHEDKTVYYACLYNKDFNSYTIIFTDTVYVNTMAQNLSIQVIIIFLILMFLSVYIVYYWSNTFVKRIRKLQTHIVNLPRNKYEVAYNDESLDEIGELTRSVEKMRLEIGQNEKTKQEMLQNLSHDFKTPIAVIKSYAEAQLDGMADEESSKIIILQAESLKNKVNRLLQYNSLEYLSKDREFEKINMSEIINEVATNYKYLTNIKMELDLDESVVFMGYRENMFTIIDNILDNAKRYAKSKIKIV